MATTAIKLMEKTVLFGLVLGNICISVFLACYFTLLCRTACVPLVLIQQDSIIGLLLKSDKYSFSK